MEERPTGFSEIFILVFTILLAFFDFFEFLPGDVDFAKNILSLLLLGYFLYRISLTGLLFGTSNRFFDVLIMISYFLLITKNIIGYASVSAEEANILAPLYSFLVNNITAIEMVSFYIGGGILIIISFFMAFFLEIRAPSLMELIHEEGTPLSGVKMLKRFASLFLVLVFFFIVVFNLVMEWLAIAVDSSLLVVAFLFYMFTMFRSHYRKLNAESFLYKIGNVGEEFYLGFMGLFQSREGIFLGISGLLVLHLLTDVANFIVPYILGFQDILYFGHLGSGHDALYVLFLKDMGLATTLLQKIYVSIIYIFNLFGMLFLLILPAYIWYKLYKKSGFFVSNKKLCLFFIAVGIFILAPVFKIKKMTAEGLVGVDILTNQILPSNISLHWVIWPTLLIGLSVYFLSFNHYIKEKLIALEIISVDIFFAVYIFYFFKSTASYYIETIKFLVFDTSKYFIAFYFILFFIIISLFYILGFIIFLAETKKEFRYIQ